MNKKTSTWTITPLLATLFLSSWGFSPVNAKPNPTPPPSQSSNQAHPTYDQAKKDLKEDVYVIYRITERIARANNIDQTPWRLVAVDEYNVNAYASEINKISLYTGLLDQLGGDSSAIACVVGHEMAHHTKRHIAMGESEKATLIEQYQKEAEQQVLQEATSAQRDATGAAVTGGILGTVGGFLGGWGGQAARTGGAAANALGRQRLNDSQTRIEAIVQKKQQELEQRLAEESRNHEFEADEMGYQYMAQAGFDPNGCLRMLSVLGRLAGAEFDTTHPAIPKRIESMKGLMRQYPSQTLAQEGDLKLRTSQPLTYELSKDQESLRVNSSHGGSASSDIERMFGQ